jgi:glutathione S-transferase
MALPLLYSYRRCPYAIRARLALRSAGVAFSLHEVVLRDKPAALLAASPKGTVPVLLLPDGQVIDQSLDIMRWALMQHDPQGWLSAAPMPEMLSLIALNDGAFKALLDRYKYPDRHPERSAAQWRDQAISEVLSEWDARLATHAHLCGEQASLADVALMPFVRQFAAVDRTWFDQAPLHHLRRWLDAWLATPLFEAVMAKPT